MNISDKSKDSTISILEIVQKGKEKMENLRFKFRAWDKDENEFVYFDLETVYAWGQDNPKEFKYTDILRNSERHTVLKDKNGKEIYEGDIVSVGYHSESEYHRKSGKVVYEQELAMFVFEDEMKNQCALCDVAVFEVIGNIYENPELLEK